MPEKLIKDGKVAVIYSPGYGAGWSTWGDREQAVDGELAQAIIDGKPFNEVSAIATKNWPDAYQGGLKQCTIQWIPIGNAFRIDEYDGAESVEQRCNITWQIA